MVKASIIIVNFNGRQNILRCIGSFVNAHKKGKYEIIVVDNNSSDGSVDALKSAFPDVTILAQKYNLGFGKANNVGAVASTGEFLFFVNNDIIFSEDVVTPLVNCLQNHLDCGVVGPLLLNTDGTYQHSYGYFPSFVNEWKTQRDTRFMQNVPLACTPKVVDWVSFAAVMIPRKSFEKISGFDERYFMYFEDADVCMRLYMIGLKALFYPQCSLAHLGGASRSKENAAAIKYEYRRSQILFYSTHNSKLQTIALRLYLIVKHLVLFFCLDKNERYTVLPVIVLALGFNTNHS